MQNKVRDAVVKVAAKTMDFNSKRMNAKGGPICSFFLHQPKRPGNLEK